MLYFSFVYRILFLCLWFDLILLWRWRWRWRWRYIIMIGVWSGCHHNCQIQYLTVAFLSNVFFVFIFVFIVTQKHWDFGQLLYYSTQAFTWQTINRGEVNFQSEWVIEEGDTVGRYIFLYRFGIAENIPKSLFWNIISKTFIVIFWKD